MFCENCGKQLAGGAKFCGYCGGASGPTIATELAVPAIPPIDAQRPALGAKQSLKDRSQDVAVLPFALLIALYAVIIFAVYSKFIDSDWASALGWTIGGAFLWPALGVGVARIAGARRWRRNLLIWAPILTTLAFIGAWPSSHYSEPDKKAIHDAATELHAVMADQRGKSADAVPQQQIEQEQLGQVTPLNRGSMSPTLASVIKTEAQLLKELGERSGARRIQIDALHMETVLTPTALSAAEGIADGRERLATARSIQHAAYKDYDDTMDSMRAQLETLPIGTRESALAGFVHSRPQVDAAMKYLMDVEDKLFARANEMLDLGEANLGRTYVQNNIIYLPDDGILRYNSLLQDIRKLASDEAGAEKRIAEMQQQGLSKVEELEKLTASP